MEHFQNVEQTLLCKRCTCSNAKPHKTQVRGHTKSVAVPSRGMALRLKPASTATSWALGQASINAESASPSSTTALPRPRWMSAPEWPPLRPRTYMMGMGCEWDVYGMCMAWGWDRDADGMGWHGDDMGRGRGGDGMEWGWDRDRDGIGIGMGMGWHGMVWGWDGDGMGMGMRWGCDGDGMRTECKIKGEM